MGDCRTFGQGEVAPLADLAAMVVADHAVMYQDSWLPPSLHPLLQKYMPKEVQKIMLGCT